jgi:hypothetical protein
MKPLRGIAVDADDAEFVYHAVSKYRADLVQYRSWLKTNAGETLPGAEIAIAEVDKEIARYLNLSRRLYDQCYATPTAQEST